jgi:hypothetical protein
MTAGREIVAWIGISPNPGERGGFGDVEVGSLGPDGGWISALMINPQNTNTIYVSSVRTMYKGTDGGPSWSASSSGLRSAALGISSVVIDSQSPGVLYASTDEGVFRSNDRAASWSEVGSDSKPDFVSSVTIDPKDPHKLYIAGRRGVFVITATPEPRGACVDELYGQAEQ